MPTFRLCPTFSLCAASQLQHSVLFVVALLIGSPAFAAEDDDAVQFFEAKIRPVLVQYCYECHAPEEGEPQGGLALNTREGARRGGDSGPAVVPGKPADSVLLSALRYDGLEMPPSGKLSPEVIAHFEKWIEQGAADPRENGLEPTTALDVDWNKARQFWSFQPPLAATLPAIAAATGWARSRLDTLVLAEMEQQDLTPSPESARQVYVRRVTFDLLGLPPTPEEVEAFLQDEAPLAQERLVDRLLASPRYGERWARFWMDLSRFAEDQAHIVGNNRSLCYPNAYKYRDWLIETLNQDLPYDEFIRTQLAADLLYPDDPSHQVALGFLGLGPKYYRRSAPEVMADEWEDRIDTVTRGLLGLTVACARCHDHKFDPIPTTDYYALAGIFASTEMFNRPLTEETEANKDGQAKKPEESLHVIRDTQEQDLHVYLRGDHTKHGPLVERRFLQVLSSESAEPYRGGSGRIQLAAAITDPGNPLTARVLVNRIWGLHFGRPLVATASNFGKLGESPTHPALLDDLAVGFVESGWSLKWLHRNIVLSSTYRQSSDLTPDSQRLDPANRYLSRMNRRRLPVESWRDSLLRAGDQLENRLGGVSIQPQEPAANRRTVYAYISRLELDSMLAMFDFPDPNAHSAGRVETTTPLQKLFLLNSPFMVQQAEHVAKRVLSETSNGAEEAIQTLYWLLFSRAATDEEVILGQSFLAEGTDDQKQWQQYAHLLMASNEMMMLD